MLVGLQREDSVRSVVGTRDKFHVQRSYVTFHWILYNTIFHSHSPSHMHSWKHGDRNSNPYA